MELVAASETSDAGSDAVGMWGTRSIEVRRTLVLCYLSIVIPWSRVQAGKGFSKALSIDAMS